MMPDPTTQASKKKVPSASAANGLLIDPVFRAAL